MKDIAAIRKNYMKSSLLLSDVDQDPIRQFERWFDQANSAGVHEPNSMHLGTIGLNGAPAGRIVLLKGLEAGRFVFYTNYQSNKGKEMDKNPAVSLTFFWPELERQVRVEGVSEKVPFEASEAYFQSRPKGSQIGAWASPQSAVIANREILEARVNSLTEQYKASEVLPCPKQWGGYAVTPNLVEFWQGRPDRLHDRLSYMPEAGAWKILRLAP